MSRQSKAAKKKVIAKQITAMHLQGNRGAKQTTPKHGKAAAKRLYTAKRRGPDDRA
jgi:hypothetical protein